MRLPLSFAFILAPSAAAWGSSSPDVCPSDEPVSIMAPYPNPWASLTKSEAYEIQSWLYQQKALNLTEFAKANLR